MNAVYESADQGDTITQLSPPIQANSPGTVVYGGHQEEHGSILCPTPTFYTWAPASALYKRTAPPPAELIRLTAYPGQSTITGLAANPANYDDV